MSNLLTVCMYTCIALSWFRPREVRPSGLAVATVTAEAAEVTAVAAVEQQVDYDTVVRFQRGRSQSSTRRSPPRRMSLEQAIAYIEDDELVEITPVAIRLRKRHLDPHARKKAERASEMV